MKFITNIFLYMLKLKDKKKGGVNSAKQLLEKLGSQEAVSEYFRNLISKRKFKKKKRK